MRIFIPFFQPKLFVFEREVSAEKTQVCFEEELEESKNVKTRR